MINKTVTVVVPSYNRAHLLSKTITSYLKNNCVKELILVDDASTDNTTQKVAELQLIYPLIKYIRLDKNSKQTFAKNIGIDNALCQYIYFGDDDSFMQDGGIDKLLATSLEYNADIVGARALYLNNNTELENLYKFIESKNKLRGEICNLNKLTFNFYLNLGQVVEVPVCHACFLIKSDLARKIKFDCGYSGAAFREETDFTIRASGSGARIVYNPFVAQINLPRERASGGAHGSSMIKYHSNNFKNNWKFLKKNQDILRQKGLTRSIYFIQFNFVFITLFYFIKSITPDKPKQLIKKILGR